ncbi:hypothetical protein Salat_2661800 [Sesamum alatum]|uniref:Uncharacterized protein n=1 Tax=Sesamum alatum TaxID=300844 RepID=A0AAE1XQ22_9LAMI|nr:hypothetical protein Salat_2661800 [Sesamum alatum]
MAEAEEAKAVDATVTKVVEVWRRRRRRVWRETSLVPSISTSLAPAGKDLSYPFLRSRSPSHSHDFSYADVLQGCTTLKSIASYVSPPATIQTNELAEHGIASMIALPTRNQPKQHGDDPLFGSDSGPPLADCTLPSHSEPFIGSAHSLPSSSTLARAEGNNAPPSSYVHNRPIDMDEKITLVASAISKDLINVNSPVSPGADAGVFDAGFCTCQLHACV